MAIIGDADIIVGADARPLKDEIETATNQIARTTSKNLSKGLSDVGKTLQNLGGKLTKSITLPAISAATAVGGIAVAAGWKRLTGIENATQSIKGLGYTAEEAGNIIKGPVLDSVKGTAFGIAEAGSAAAGALAAGIEPGETLTRHLKLVGDAAAQSNTDFAAMARMLTDVEAAGYVSGAALNQMMENGLYATPILAEYLGITQEEVKKLASEGQISADVFRDAMENKIGGSALEMGDTMQGAIANTMAAFGRFGERILQDVYPKVRGAFDGLIEALDGDALSNVADFLSDTLVKAFDAVSTAISNVVNWWNTLSPAMQKTVGIAAGIAVALGPLLLILGKISSGIGAVIGAFSGMGGAMSVLLGPVGLVVGGLMLLFTASEDFRNAVINLVTVIGGGLMGIFEALWPVIETLIGVVANLAETIGNALAPVIDSLSSILEVLFAALTPILGVLAELIGSLLAPLAQIIGVVVQAVAPLVSIVLSLVEVALAPLLMILSPILELFGKIIGPILELAFAMSPLNIILQLLTPLLEWLAELLSGALSVALEKTSEIFSNVFGPVLEAAAKGIEWFSEKISGLTSFLGISTDKMESDTTSSLSSITSSFLSSGSSIESGWTSTFSGLTSQTSSGMGSIESTIGGSAFDIESIMAGTGDALESDWMSTMSGLDSETQASLSSMFGTVDTYSSGMESALGSSGSNMSSMWGDALGGMSRNTSTQMGNVAGTVSNDAAAAQRAAANEAREMQQAWLAQMRALTAATRENTAAMRSNMEAQANAMQSQMGSSGSSIVQSFADGLSRAFESAKAVVSRGMSAIRNLFPFSPAKEGPFSGRGWVGRSGESVGETFARSAADALRNNRSLIERELDGIAESFTSTELRATPTVGLNALGGYGDMGLLPPRTDLSDPINRASAVGPGAVTNMRTFTIEPGAIQVIGNNPEETSLEVLNRLVEELD